MTWTRAKWSMGTFIAVLIFLPGAPCEAADTLNLNAPFVPANPVPVQAVPVQAIPAQTAPAQSAPAQAAPAPIRSCSNRSGPNRTSSIRTSANVRDRCDHRRTSRASTSRDGAES